MAHRRSKRRRPRRRLADCVAVASQSGAFRFGGRQTAARPWSPGRAAYSADLRRRPKAANGHRSFFRIDPPQALDFRSFRLVLESATDRRTVRPRRHPFPGRNRRFRDQVDKAGEGVLAVRLAGTVASGRDHDFSVLRQPRPGETRETFPDIGRKGRRATRVEAQLHGRRDLIDVLAAGSVGANEPFEDLFVPDRNFVVHSDHDRPANRASTQPAPERTGTVSVVKSVGPSQPFQRQLRRRKGDVKGQQFPLQAYSALCRSPEPPTTSVVTRFENFFAATPFPDIRERAAEGLPALPPRREAGPERIAHARGRRAGPPSRRRPGPENRACVRAPPLRRRLACRNAGWRPAGGRVGSGFAPFRGGQVEERGRFRLRADGTSGPEKSITHLCGGDINDTSLVISLMHSPEPPFFWNAFVQALSASFKS